MLQKLKLALYCALLVALTGVAVQAVLLLRVATRAAVALPLAVSSELRDTRSMLATQVEAARVDILQRTERQVAGVRADLVGQVAATRDVLDRRVGDSLARIDTALSVADVRLGEVTTTAAGFRADLAPTFANTASITGHADEAAAVLFRRDALPAQTLGLIAAAKVTAGETAQTMRDVRGAVPGFLAQGQAITTNVNAATLEFSGVAKNLNALTKPKWYDRLLGYGLNGVMIYRNLNPVTNLTVKGAQFLTSRP